MDLKYKYVMFDFDGTVIDSGPGILKCARHTIGQFGFDMPGEDVLRKFIGPPLKLSFMNTFDISSMLADKVVSVYRETYADTNSIMDARIYGGVLELIGELKDAGARVGVASAKREVTVRETLKMFGIAEYFDAVSGAGENMEYADKTGIMRDCMDRMAVEPYKTVMVGDSDYDAIGSESCGIDFCAVLWGYGFCGIEDVSRFKCRYIAGDVPSLRRFLLGD